MIQSEQSGGARLIALVVFAALAATLAGCAPGKRGLVPAGTSEPDKFLFDKGNEALFANTGVYGDHTYTVLDAYEKNGVKYVKVRNPWGESEPPGRFAAEQPFEGFWWIWAPLRFDDYMLMVIAQERPQMYRAVREYIAVEADASSAVGSASLDYAAVDMRE